MLGRTVRLYREAYADLPREVWFLAGVTLVNRAGTMVLPFLTLYLTQRLEFSATQAGALVSLYGVGSMAGSWIGGWLSDRFDPNRIQALALFGTAAGFLVLMELETFASLALTVVAIATVGDAFRPALFVATARYTRPRFRARAYTLIRLAVNLGMSIGPAVGGFLAVHHYRWLFLGDAATCGLAAATLMVILGKAPAIVTPTPGDTAHGRSPWRDLPFIAFLALTFGIALVFFQLFSTFPLHLRTAYRMSERGIGSLLAANALLVALFEMILVRAVEHRNHIRVAGVGAFLVCAGMAALALGPPAWIAVASMLVWTVGEMLALPMTNAIVADRADPSSTGRYMGAYTVSFSAALVAAPILGTAIWERLGPPVLWAAIAVIGVILGAGFFALSRRLIEPPRR